MSNSTTTKTAIMRTINFSSLKVSFQINDDREVIGFQKLPTVYPSANSLDNHNNLIDKLRGETPRENLQFLRYSFSNGGKEWYACPQLKVWWIEDFA